MASTVDPNIALSYRQPRLLDPVETAGQAYLLKDLAGRAKVRDIQVKLGEEELQSKQRFSSVLGDPENYDTDESGKPVLSDESGYKLMQADSDRAIKYSKQVTEATKVGIDMLKVQEQASTAKLKHAQFAMGESDRITGSSVSAYDQVLAQTKDVNKANNAAMEVRNKEIKDLVDKEIIDPKTAAGLLQQPFDRVAAQAHMDGSMKRKEQLHAQYEQELLKLRQEQEHRLNAHQQWQEKHGGGAQAMGARNAKIDTSRAYIAANPPKIMDEKTGKLKDNPLRITDPQYNDVLRMAGEEKRGEDDSKEASKYRDYYSPKEVGKSAVAGEPMPGQKPKDEIHAGEREAESIHHIKGSGTKDDPYDVISSPPPVEGRKKGIYKTPKGMLEWDGNEWVNP